MASNYTEHYGLCQWEATDQVLRTEFNEDNAKIDAALEGLKSICNCQFYFQSYIGTGENGPITYHFPKRPLLVIIQGSSSFMCAVNGNNCVHGSVVPNTTFITSIRWGETSMELGASDYSALSCSNSKDTQYLIFAILDVNS